VLSVAHLSMPTFDLASYGVGTFSASPGTVSSIQSNIIATPVTSVTLPTHDIVYSSSTGLLYASVPTDSTTLPNSIVPIDPSTGQFGTPISVGTNPRQLVISSDGRYLYAVTGDIDTVQQYDLVNQTLGGTFALDSGGTFGEQIGQIEAIAGHPDQVIIVKRYPRLSPSAAGTIIVQFASNDGVETAVELPDHVGAGAGTGGPDLVTVDSSGATAYGYQNTLSSFTFWKMGIDSNGVHGAGGYPWGLPGLSGYGVGRIAASGNRIFTNTGNVIDLTTEQTVGNFEGGGNFLIDEGLNCLFSVSDSGTSHTLRIYDLATLQLMKTVDINDIAGDSRDLVRMGTEGLGFRTTANKVVLLPFDSLLGINLVLSSPTVDEAAGVINFEITQTGSAAGPFTVEFATVASLGQATAGSDFTSTAGQLTFSGAANQTQTISVPITNDTLFETDESFKLHLDNVRLSGQAVSEFSTEGTGTIRNDDSPPNVTLSLSPITLVENGGTATVTATLAQPSAFDTVISLGFNGTATNETDYTASANTITIPAGSTTGSITLTGLSDAVDETSEQIVVEVTAVSGGTEETAQQVTTTITNARINGAVVQHDASSGGDSLYVFGTEKRNSIVVKPVEGTTVRYSVIVDKQLLGPLTISSGSLGRIYLYGRGGKDLLDARLVVAHDVVIEGGAKNDTILGGDRADILLGGDGDDTIYGGKGRDLIIGGAGKDTLFGELVTNGSSSENILIGNRTSYDTNLAALRTIMTEWSSSNAFGVRAPDLSSGAHTNGLALNSTTVLNDQKADTLYGGEEADWFLDFGAGKKKDKTNKAGNDRLN
jgi:hypothetical protein